MRRRCQEEGISMIKGKETFVNMWDVKNARIRRVLSNMCKKKKNNYQTIRVFCVIRALLMGVSYVKFQQVLGLKNIKVVSEIVKTKLQLGPGSPPPPS